MMRRALLAATTLSLLAGVVLALLGMATPAAVAWVVGPVLLIPGLTWATVRGIVRAEPGVDVVALLAMVGALLAGEHLAGSIIAVMLTGGEALEAAAGRRAEQALSALLAHAPRVAHRLRDGVLQDVPVEVLVPGDRVVVKPGEVVPVDGALEGDAVTDESTLTGESRPVHRSVHDRVASGATNVGTSMTLVATATAAESTFAGIVALVEHARRARAPFVRMADRYATWFVPLTLLVAGGAWLASGDPVRALAVLVVATPCPLLLAAPIAITSGISRAARRGVIVKHGGALEALAGVRTVCVDKTGTVTTGHPRLAEVVPAPGWGAGEVLRLAASAEQLSPHPFAPALVAAARAQDLALVVPERAEEVAGEGVRATVDGHEVTVGSPSLVLAGAPVPPEAAAAARRAAVEGSSVALVGVDGAYAAALHVEDPLRVDAPRTMARLRALGVGRTVLLTGDQQAVAEAVGMALGTDEVLAGRTPAGKVESVRRLAQEGPTAMVGDGVNDAPALAVADVGIAMGARGATAAGEAAEMVITVDRLDRLAEALVIARRTRAIARQSVLVGMALSLLAMGVAAAGMLPPVAGALLQEGIDVAAILNALRVLRVRTGPDAPAVQQERGAAFLAAHRHLAAGVEAIRRAALVSDEEAGGPAATRALQEVATFVHQELLPHERTEQPLLDAMVRAAHGGQDAVGSLQRVHREIERLARVLDAQARALSPDGPGPDMAVLRPTLLALHTLITFQLAQEEEVYLALTDHAGSPPPRAPAPVPSTR